jgi:predicted HTH transcriptional regulator
MRRLGICEKKGSGIDKVISYNEIYQLPAPEILIQEKHTKVIIYETLNQMDKKISKSLLSALLFEICFK